MQAIVGTTLPVFIGVTLVLMGAAAYMTGQALAGKWRPSWQVYAYCVLLGLGDRFAVFALFQGDLASLSGYLIDTVILTAIAVFAYRTTMARKMVSQYPWLYERAGLFAYRDRVADGDER